MRIFTLQYAYTRAFRLDSNYFGNCKAEKIFLFYFLACNIVIKKLKFQRKLARSPIIFF
jgi:hypothetical protein